MPKGDWKRLKADTDDGYTQISNLFLEALAMSRLSGQEIRAVLYLWRRTYGWQMKGNIKRKEAQIPKSQWATSLNTSERRALRTIAGLVQKGIFKRQDLGSGKGFVYSMNTQVSKWQCLPLREFVTQIQMLYGPINIPFTIGVAETVHPLTLLKKKINKEEETIKENILTDVESWRFPHLQIQLDNSNDKIAYLVKVFKRLHSHAPENDLNGTLGGRLSKIADRISNDYRYLLQLIWQSASVDIAGSHLNYIDGMIRKFPGQKISKVRDPYKFLKGKYGHMIEY